MSYDALMYLTPGDPCREEVERLFFGAWNHPSGKKAVIENVFYVKRNFSDQARRHLSSSSLYDQAMTRKIGYNTTRCLFHGAKRACSIGNSRGSTRTCTDQRCVICSIVRHSFDVCWANASGMFGAGLYFSVRASKADRYYKDVDKRFKNKVVILSNVCVGRSEERYQAKKENPKPGYDSVEGMTKSQGGALENPETVVYTNDAVCPTAMVVYRLV